MKVFVFVEGRSDVVALEALWRSWIEDLRNAGHGIALVALDDKSRFLRKIGPRAAEKLLSNDQDLAMGLPDLYPNAPYASSRRYQHANAAALKQVQVHLVSQALEEQGASRRQVPSLIQRFASGVLKHDLEMLLLAARDRLRKYLARIIHEGA